MIRKGVPDDAEAIESIRIAAWRAAYGDFMPADYLAKLDPLHNTESLRGRLTGQDSAVAIWVAERRDAVVAFSILGKPRYTATDDTIELWALNVDPANWRKGLGQALIESAMASAVEAGYRNIELWCIRGNLPAEAAYERAGFLPTGKERTSSNLTGSPILERLYCKNL